MAWQPTLVFLPGESHGRRSLVGYNPPGYKESDTTEATEAHTLMWGLRMDPEWIKKMWYIQWSITQPLKRMKQCHLQQHGWTRDSHTE